MNEYLDRELIKLEDMIGFYASRFISYPLIPPEHVYFSLTNRCCLRCVMCDIPKSSARQEDELTTEEAKKIILQIKELGVRHLILSGGEPLLRQDLMELIRFSREIGISWVDIITNGILFNDDFVQKLIKSGLNHVTVSLDGLAIANDTIRGEGSFEKSVNAIDKLNYYKEKLNVTHPSIGINFTILNKNIDDMLKIVEFARTKKCNTVVFQPVLVSNVTMQDRKKSPLWPLVNELRALESNIRKLVDIKEKGEGVFIYTDPAILKAIPDYFRGKRPGKRFKCYEGIKRIVITCEGKLWSCTGIYGDLRKDNLKRVWFSEEVQKIRKAVKKCKTHCLQDCVYFPMDISGQVKQFSSGILNSQDNNDSRLRLVSRIDFCTNELSGRLRSNFTDFFSLKREIKRLNVIKKDLLKGKIAIK